MERKKEKGKGKGVITRKRGEEKGTSLVFGMRQVAKGLQKVSEEKGTSLVFEVAKGTSLVFADLEFGLG